MNVDDIKGEMIPTDFSEHDRLDLIFMRQHALMDKYIPIEVANNLCDTPDCPVDIHDRFGQARLKNFFWRTTEELGEACEARRIHPELRNHVLEELADALHFLVEAHLLAGYMSKDVCKVASGCKLEAMVDNVVLHDSLDSGCFEVIYHMTLASNCLKNRPWKQNHQLTDCCKFRGYMMRTIPNLIAVFVDQDMTADEIFRMYWKKSEVNQFRQRSNY